MASLLEVRALRALGLHAIGDESGALAALADALALGEPEGYVRAFADEGPAMASLLRGLARVARKEGQRGTAQVPADYVARVLRAARPPQAGARSTAMAEALTGRELEVLRMLAAGKRNREIADELVVTLDTVKKHVTHTFEKLGAANRTEAVAKARELGLLP